MADMKGSGVYLVEVDESFTSFDVVNMSVLVPMWTKKGQKYTSVSEKNYKKVLGWDLKYNSNYLGLKNLVEKVGTVNVWRINNSATYGNLVITKNGSSFSFSGVTDPSVLSNTSLVKSDVFSVSSLNFSPVLSSQPVLSSLKIKKDGVVIGVTDINGSISGSNLSGSVDVDKNLILNFGSSFVTPFQIDVEYIEQSEVALIVYMESAGDWDKLAVSVERYLESSLVSVIESSNFTYNIGFPIERNSFVIKNLNETVLATSDNNGIIRDINSTVVGSVSTNGQVVLTDTSFLGSTPLNCSFEFYATEIFYKLSVYRKNVNDTYTKLEEQKISSNSSSVYYANNVSFENVKVEILGDFNSGVLPLGSVTKLDLKFASDGTIPVSPDDLDFSVLKKDGSFFVCMNGLIIAPLVSKIIEWASTRRKFVLCDTPNLKTKEEIVFWKSKIYPSERSMFDFRGDFTVVDNQSVCIYPSVKRLLAFVNMYKKTGYLGYPSAGYSYGAVSSTNLYEFEIDPETAKYFKINKVNYIKDGSQGAVLWEHRTNYAYESDLSYSTTVINLTFLGNRCQKFIENFVFKFITPDILSLIYAGLYDIISDYINLGFVWSADIVIPSFENVKKEGARFLTIDIPVKFAEDGQEFSLQLKVQAQGF